VTDAREEILARIRGALDDVPATERPGDVPVPRDYDRLPARSRPDSLRVFAERLADYRAEVREVTADAVAASVTRACAARGLRRLGVPSGVPPAWRPHGVELVADASLEVAALDGLDGALTGCAAAIAETGTLILDGDERCGRRALTLVPDHHICIVEADQVIDGVPEAIAAVAAAATEQRRPITLVSGPSATSDIELTRVEGVHGPRHLLVLIVS